MTKLAARPGNVLKGRTDVPGDKSISHRALMIGAVAVGRTTVSGLLQAEDVLHTAAALRALGAGVQQSGSDWLVDGVGVGGLTSPDDIIDLGNSGTAARLLLGLMATHDLKAHVTGDHSLRSRPMNRVIDPLSRFGATFDARDGGRMPLVVEARRNRFRWNTTCRSRPPRSSRPFFLPAQYAGRDHRDRTGSDPGPHRKHAEGVLAPISMSCCWKTEDRRISIRGYAELAARDVIVPGDPSSAAFPGVAALMVPGSEIAIDNIGINPLRAGLFERCAIWGRIWTLPINAMRPANPSPTFSSGTAR